MNGVSIEKALEKANNGKTLTYEEEEGLCLFLIGAQSDDPGVFKKYQALCADQTFITGFYLKASPNPVISTRARNYDHVAELAKRVADFEAKYDSNSSDDFIRQVRKEYNIELKEIKRKYSGEDLIQKSNDLKAKMEYLRIRSDRLYHDYLAKHNLPTLDIAFRGMAIRFDKVSIMHILNRHVIRNGFLQIDLESAKSQLNMTSLEQVIDNVKHLFSVIPDSVTRDNSKELTFYFKKDLAGDIFAVHTKLINESTHANAKKIHRLETYYPLNKKDKIDEVKARGVIRLKEGIYLYNE
ncbi:hypothetical protein SAMN02746009_02427 [Hymenobacter psychrotolerans DSM 18569]|uniref:Uncharacterized protein n=2 Tax=Hymenobacter psychrotolerans TaxID=344998 RepID=A0A1M6Z551_9BACT|nr:hypothetical protein SAMN02746009_02427 [Hymenobacter psychrotolerans DSM 18569]